MKRGYVHDQESNAYCPAFVAFTCLVSTGGRRRPDRELLSPGHRASALENPETGQLDALSPDL